jgi:hypothetical protein
LKFPLEIFTEKKGRPQNLTSTRITAVILRLKKKIEKERGKQNKREIEQSCKD